MDIEALGIVIHKLCTVVIPYKMRYFVN